MKNELKNALAEIESGMGELEGFIIVACDSERQYSLFNGKCYKMVSHLAENSEQMLNLFTEATQSAKMNKTMSIFFNTANTAME
jgi:hypothetical protein